AKRAPPAAVARGGGGWVCSPRGAVRAAADALGLERGEAALHLRRIPGDPGDDRGRDHGDAHIGGNDEDRMRSEIDHHVPRAAAWRLSVSTRRLRISVRIATMCRVRNNSVNARTIRISGRKTLPAMRGPVAVKMLEGWWSVFHQSTENLMTGMSM